MLPEVLSRPDSEHSSWRRIEDRGINNSELAGQVVNATTVRVEFRKKSSTAKDAKIVGPRQYQLITFLASWRFIFNPEVINKFTLVFGEDLHEF